MADAWYYGAMVVFVLVFSIFVIGTIEWWEDRHERRRWK